MELDNREHLRRVRRRGREFALALVHGTLSFVATSTRTARTLERARRPPCPLAPAWRWSPRDSRVGEARKCGHGRVHPADRYAVEARVVVQRDLVTRAERGVGGFEHPDDREAAHAVGSG